MRKITPHTYHMTRIKIMENVHKLHSTTCVTFVSRSCTPSDQHTLGCTVETRQGKSSGEYTPICHNLKHTKGTDYAGPTCIIQTRCLPLQILGCTFAQRLSSTFADKMRLMTLRISAIFETHIQLSRQRGYLDRSL